MCKSISLNVQKDGEKKQNRGKISKDNMVLLNPTKGERETNVWENGKRTATNENTIKEN
jgi:hypothetical protein